MVIDAQKPDDEEGFEICVCGGALCVYTFFCGALFWTALVGSRALPLPTENFEKHPLKMAYVSTKETRHVDQAILLQHSIGCAWK